MDFCFGGDEGPRLELELSCGEVVKRLVDVKKPGTAGSNLVMTVDELSNLDDVEFLLCDRHDSPGALLKKDGHVSNCC